MTLRMCGSLFDLLVARINESLGQRVKGDKKDSRTISILDIFGFEHFKTNHFEQFCINYANEKLQGHFNEYNFSLEIQEYQRENIEWSYADFQFQTNTKCIEMIEGKRRSLSRLFFFVWALRARALRAAARRGARLNVIKKSG